MAGRKRGAPTKYGDAMHKCICDELLLGSSRTTAAEYCGIDRGTLAEWVASKPAFSRDVTRAIASVKRTASVTVRKAIQAGDVATALKYLSYQERDEWSDPPTKHEISGPDGEALTIRVIYADDRPDAS